MGAAPSTDTGSAAAAVDRGAVQTRQRVQTLQNLPSLQGSAPVTVAVRDPKPQLDMCRVVQEFLGECLIDMRRKQRRPTERPVGVKDIDMQNGLVCRLLFEHKVATNAHTRNTKTYSTRAVFTRENRGWEGHLFLDLYTTYGDEDEDQNETILELLLGKLPVGSPVTLQPFKDEQSPFEDETFDLRTFDAKWGEFSNWSNDGANSFARAMLVPGSSPLYKENFSGVTHDYLVDIEWMAQQFVQFCLSQIGREQQLLREQGGGGNGTATLTSKLRYRLKEPEKIMLSYDDRDGRYYYAYQTNFVKRADLDGWRGTVSCQLSSDGKGNLSFGISLADTNDDFSMRLDEETFGRTRIEFEGAPFEVTREEYHKKRVGFTAYACDMRLKTTTPSAAAAATK
ncbi:MAG: hypothetical protein CMI16_07110 [Opitutaceae bacterium]|nr:hypothetical protein [Opitutaceae bacterium]|tara:strand:+ start:143 stop:1333 length:1191 start_codon:yes stop_codon:yes gene_type:complete